MIAEDGYQHDVGSGGHRPQQGQTVATVADCNRAPAERKKIHQGGGSTAERRAVINRHTSCRMTRGKMSVQTKVVSALCFQIRLGEDADCLTDLMIHRTHFSHYFNVHPGEDSDPIIFSQ